MSKRRRILSRLSSSSSDNETLITFKKVERDPNSYQSLCEDYWEQCEFCDAEFFNKYNLIQHNITHIIIPLIKQSTHPCKECQQHFPTEDDLIRHTWQEHNKIILKSNGKKEQVPEILKSLVEKQLLVKCEDDISVLVNKKLRKNTRLEEDSENDKLDAANVSETQPTHSKIIVGKKDSVKAIKPTQGQHIINGITSIDRDDSAKAINPAQNQSILENTNENVVKEEPVSPIIIKERPSSPIDDEKESIRHRLLFEEDEEDTLFRDISNECHVNIDLLCREVSFDFDDALVVSDSDDQIVCDDDENCAINTDTGNNYENDVNIYENNVNNYVNDVNNYVNRTNNTVNMHNHVNGMNNYGTSYCRNGTNDYAQIKLIEPANPQNKIDVYANIINNFGYNNTVNGINVHSLGMNNFNNEEINPHNQINNLEYESDCEIIEDGIKCELIEQEQNISESNHTKSIHYEDLISPEIWECKICKKEFYNRFKLIQHETRHITMKIEPRANLCCYCDQYIPGNKHSLGTHMANTHPKLPLFRHDLFTDTCTKCGLKYHNSVRHILNHHRPYKCDDCGEPFETVVLKKNHICDKAPKLTTKTKISLMRLCDICFTFMKIHFQSGQKFEEIGFKDQPDQTCEKCKKLCSSLRLVTRWSFRQNDGVKPMGVASATESGRKMADVHQNLPNVGQKATEVGRKMPDAGQNMAEIGRKLPDVGRNVPDVINRSRTKGGGKPLTNKQRLYRIQNRLKMMKLINKC